MVQTGPYRKRKQMVQTEVNWKRSYGKSGRKDRK